MQACNVAVSLVPESLHRIPCHTIVLLKELSYRDIRLLGEGWRLAIVHQSLGQLTCNLFARASVDATPFTLLPVTRLPTPIGSLTWLAALSVPALPFRHELTPLRSWLSAVRGGQQWGQIS